MTGCPCCGHPGDGDDVLADDQRWCPTDCPVVSFHADREGGLPRLFDQRDRETFREAVDRWGKEAQMDMATEESGELIRELAGFIQDVADLVTANSRVMRGRYDEEDLVDELADIAIMREQLTEYLGREKVEVRVETKMDRLRERLADDDGGRD